MHESGLARRVVDAALAEAARRRGRLGRIHLRLGALAGGSPDHVRDHVAIELAERGLDSVELSVTADPDHPGGVELTGLDLRAEP